MLEIHQQIALLKPSGGSWHRQSPVVCACEHTHDIRVHSEMNDEWDYTAASSLATPKVLKSQLAQQGASE